MMEYVNKENLIKRLIAKELEAEKGFCKPLTWNDAVDIVFGMPPTEVYKKEEWLDKLKAVLEKAQSITDELRAYDGGSEAIKDE